MACPTAAIKAHVKYARLGVLLILEKPIAAIAAKKPSSKIFTKISFHMIPKTVS